MTIPGLLRGLSIKPLKGSKDHPFCGRLQRRGGGKYCELEYFGCLFPTPLSSPTASTQTDRSGSSSRDRPSIKSLKSSKRSSIMRMSGEPGGGITHSEEVVCLTNIWESGTLIYGPLLSRDGCSEGWRKILRIRILWMSIFHPSLSL
ncbi:hypothetical protein CEXT_2121 [Caerostris extrusa]|uniref:Uncharacterized protein n=1 Tax=Caerostris extrusa TaxID=172846 RepID=A0AAV4V0F8_CAEEX|nr:hypothetical protein CEXT_2121 [Caerostris extrusa]